MSENKQGEECEERGERETEVKGGGEAGRSGRHTQRRELGRDGGEKKKEGAEA